MSTWSPLAKEYDPLKCGSIDGTDNQVHDRAISRAIQANYKPNKNVKGDPHKTLFVCRLNYSTTPETLRQIFSTFGDLKNVTLIRNVVTGFSRGYAFIEFKNTDDLRHAWKEANGLIIDDFCILVDYEHKRLMKGWVPRRLGGGFGGKKESGQLRFGCRDRPFRKPINLQSGQNNKHIHGSKRDFLDSHSKNPKETSHIKKSQRSRSPETKRSQRPKENFKRNQSSSSSNKSRKKYSNRD